MQLSQLKSGHYRLSKKRVGRGGKTGTYAGRGLKGQKARAGAKFEPLIRPLIKRYHKLKGIGFSSKPSKITAVSLDVLAKKFKEGEIVSPQSLKEKGIISSRLGSKQKVKILASGSLKKKLIFENCLFSKTAKAQIEKVGGKIKT